jgi:hypothetical protein
MATRSHIGKQLPDGSVRFIYCHLDGYPEHNGQILVEHYKDESKVDQLLELGDLSMLRPEIGEEQDFDRTETHNNNWCLAYERDRKDSGKKATLSYFDDFLEQTYNYLFKDGKWHCYTDNGYELLIQ